MEGKLDKRARAALKTERRVFARWGAGPLPSVEFTGV